MSADILYYLLTGAFAGFSAGLLGVGGGLIIVPVLYIVFTTLGFADQNVMHMALATSLATIIVTSISSTRAHHRKQAVLWPTVMLLGPGIAIGAWLGALAASAVDSQILKPVFGVFELLVAIQLLSKASPGEHEQHIGRAKAFAGGNVIGFISAIVGIGGGTMTVPFLHWHKIAMRHAVATSAACGLPIAVFGTASYVMSGWNIESLPAQSLGYVYLPAFLGIIVTSFLFAPLGARAAHSIPENTLRTIFGVLLLALSAKMLL